MNTKAILLFGGGSDERRVSAASAQNLALNYQFSDLWWLTPSGEIHSVSQNELLQHQRPFETEFSVNSQAIYTSLKEALTHTTGQSFFLGFHGTEGEDGTIQELFESMKIPFTGSGATSSRLCFDKTAAKSVVKAQGCTVAPQIFFRGTSIDDWKDIHSFFDAHQKIVIKPIANGSSIGLYIISNAKELDAALESLKQSANLSLMAIMAEKFISGRELTVGVIHDGSTIRALPPSEVLLKSGHAFDFSGKYLGLGSTEITPAELTEKQLKLAQDLAIKAHSSLQCYGYSRTDMILTPDDVVFLETNTLPGLTKASFIPQQLAAANLKMDAFIERQLQLGIRRFEF